MLLCSYDDTAESVSAEGERLCSELSVAVHSNVSRFQTIHLVLGG